MKLDKRCSFQAQTGVALFTILVFLIALTLLAITSMQGATIGERMARNSVDKVVATQAAEAALRDAQADILALNSSGISCIDVTPCRSDRPIAGVFSNGFIGDVKCTDGQCFTNPAVPFTTPVWQDSSQWSNGVVYGKYTGAKPISVVSKQPRYLIEGFMYDREWKAFRISALGFGADSHTQVMLQSIFYP